MEPQPQSYRINWQGIEIEATYTPRKWGVIAHLEVRSVAPEGAPLPITSTGYRSHFHPIGTVEAHGGDVVAQVSAWMDEEAKKPDWQALCESQPTGRAILIPANQAKPTVTGPHRKRQIPNLFCTIPTQAKIAKNYPLFSMDYTNPKMWSG